jgi:hypothetical protein
MNFIKKSFFHFISTIPEKHLHFKLQNSYLNDLTLSYNSSASVVVSILGIRSEIASSNPAFTLVTF